MGRLAEVRAGWQCDWRMRICMAVRTGGSVEQISGRLWVWTVDQGAAHLTHLTTKISNRRLLEIVRKFF